MNKRCCQYPICFIHTNSESKCELVEKFSQVMDVAASELKYVFDRNKTDTAEIYITCKVLNKTFHLGVHLADKVKDVKRHIKRLEKMPKALLHLFFKGILLGHENTLAECGVKHKSALTLGIKLHTAWCKKCKPPCMQTTRELSKITVRTILGDCYDVILPLSNPVETLKELIEQKFKIYPDHQLLMNDGEVLEDDATLEDYNITSESNLVLLLFQYENCFYCSGCAEADDKPTILLNFLKYKITWVLNAHHTVKQLKETSYQYLYHIHPDLQRVVFQQKELQDDKTLDECGVKNGSELLITLHFDCRKCDICNGSLS